MQLQLHVQLHSPNIKLILNYQFKISKRKIKHNIINTRLPGMGGDRQTHTHTNRHTDIETYKLN